MLSSVPEGPGRIPTAVKILAAALAWLLAIGFLHWRINGDHDFRRTVRLGYMPVVSNLACPILDEATRRGDGARLEAVRFASFAELGEALREGRIEAAFMIAPLAIVLRQQGEDLRVVYIGNRHESTLVVRAGEGIRSFSDLAGRTLAVPMRFSGHNLVALDLAERFGVEGRVKIVEMNPPDMAAAMASGALDACFVGEPFAAQAVSAGHAEVLYRVEEVSPGFICNLMLMRGAFVDRNPALAARIVEMAARSGVWAGRDPAGAARVAARHWNQSEDLVLRALTTPMGRIVYDRFIPREDELREMAQKMVKRGLSGTDDIRGLVDDRFARAADLSGVTDLSSIDRNPGRTGGKNHGPNIRPADRG